MDAGCLFISHPSPRLAAAWVWLSAVIKFIPAVRHWETTRSSLFLPPGGRRYLVATRRRQPVGVPAVPLCSFAHAQFRLIPC